MARFNYGGFDEVELTFKDLTLMNDETKKKIIQAGAEVAVENLKSSLTDLGLKRTGQLIAGVKFKFKLKDGDVLASVSSYGKRKNGYTGERIVTHVGKKKTTAQHRGNYQGTNEEVLYLLEYGTPRMRPRRPFSRLESDPTPIYDAMCDEYIEWLKEKGF